MKVGDLVVWKGFGCIDYIDIIEGLSIIGIIVNIWISPYDKNDKRIDVLWGGGNYGKGLFPETIEVLSEN